MPIPRHLRRFYAPESGWPVTRQRILKRAGNKCERCRKPDKATILTCSGKGRMFWMPANGGRWRDQDGKLYRRLTAPWLRYGLSGPRAVKVVLAVAHKNHVAGDDRDENLSAWCQWCHLAADAAQHKLTRSERKDQARPLLWEAA